MLQLCQIIPKKIALCLKLIRLQKGEGRVKSLWPEQHDETWWRGRKG